VTVRTDSISISTRGFTDIIDITADVSAAVQRAELNSGAVTVFVSGSTASVTTIEYEPGLLHDIPEMLDKIAPMNKHYHHDATWGDGNGYAHVRAALIGCSLTVPFTSGQLRLGTWQQIVLIDFDNRPRQREVILQMMGE